MRGSSGQYLCGWHRALRRLLKTHGTARSKWTPKLVSSIHYGKRRSKMSLPVKPSHSMNSSTTSRFWLAYRALPPDVRAQARKAYRLWQENPRHSSLRFAPKGDYWSVRVSQGWRALGRMHEGGMVWFWIGSHDEYERLIRG